MSTNVSRDRVCDSYHTDKAQHLPCSTIKQWEEAGASLMSMLEHYKSVCLTLAPDSLSTGARPEDLAARILSAFEVHVAISQQLIECTSALQKRQQKSHRLDMMSGLSIVVSIASLASAPYGSVSR
ncbi:hypothetical protein RSAG8_06763, partial [Rhizoctonia solani AG-8 WAC10335]